MTEEDYIKKQIELNSNIRCENTVNLSQVQTVAGVDLAYWKEEEQEYAVCCIVIINYNTFEVIERVSYADKIKVPYIPGCLAFREVPLFLETYKKVTMIPDVIFFDGNGYLHPRHMGLATHAGILIQKATVGIAKSYYKVGDVDFVMPANTAQAYTEIEWNGEHYGRVLRTHVNVKPIFLSVGNAIDINTATQMANRLTTRESHVPIPTRLADLMTHEKRKELTEKR
ncbi:MAG: endonuclease V [Lachnospiraceae bacterium]|jgi:deoxyribonuclease V|nr:endonuclease V [Lachnospiraceae bacterium]